MAIVSSETLHASCIAINGHAALIEGRSGSGKSDLALRLIDRGAALVSDDYTIVRRDRQQLIASAPDTIRGKLEVRGLGIVELPATDAPVLLVVSLVENDIERLPAALLKRRIAGIELPIVELKPFEASAAARVAMALRHLGAR